MTDRHRIRFGLIAVAAALALGACSSTGPVSVANTAQNEQLAPVDPLLLGHVTFLPSSLAMVAGRSPPPRDVIVDHLVEPPHPVFLPCQIGVIVPE